MSAAGGGLRDLYPPIAPFATGTLRVSPTVRTGDTVEIWVDENGSMVGKPKPVETATFDHLRNDPGRYSRIRLWGSVGFIATVLGGLSTILQFLWIVGAFAGGRF